MNYGRYQIIRELGKGAMGTVYQGHDPEIDRLVALKVLREDRLSSEAFVQRFLKEAKAIGRLSHPNVVAVYDIGQDHGTVYIAMEFLEGDPLSSLVERQGFSLAEVINLGVQVAEALDYAHQKGIIHRDVKPSNIIVQANGQIKITDFGIAHIEDPSATVQTQAGEILGTPAYMSPEQAQSRPVDGRSDLFSLGVILYELSTGKRPFGGTTLGAIFQALIQENPPPPAKVNPLLRENFSQVIMKCLRKKPEERFGTGKALADVLKSCLPERERMAKVGPSPRSQRKNLIFYLLLVIILIAGIGGFSYYYFLPPKPEADKVLSPLIRRAYLNVESTPGGAEVFIDGMFMGKTPLKVKLSVGRHEVRMTLPDHYDWEAQVQLKEEIETPLLVRFVPVVEKKP